MGFFARWWDEQSTKKKTAVKALVASGQLEFINGGWRVFLPTPASSVLASQPNTATQNLNGLVLQVHA